MTSMKKFGIFCAGCVLYPFTDLRMQTEQENDDKKQMNNRGRFNLFENPGYN